MPYKAYWATSLTGGTTGCLDKIPGAALADKDICLVILSTGDVYEYWLDIDSAASESSPDIIAPDNDGGDKRWLLKSINNQDVSSDATVTFGTINALTLAAQSVGFTIAGGTTSKTLTVAETLTLDGASGKTLTLEENLTISDGTDITLAGVGQANTLTLYESLTIGDGNDGTITFSAASKVFTIDETATLSAKANLAGPTFSGTVTVPSTNFTVGTQVLTETNLTDLLDGGDTTLHDHDGITENTTARHVAITLNASATTGGLSLSTQEISHRAATNAQTGYATAAHITAIEANTTDSHATGSDTTLGTMTADIDMNGSYQVVGLQAPAAAGEAIRQTAKITEVKMEAADDHVTAANPHSGHALESVLGTSISTGLLLDATALKVSTTLQAFDSLLTGANKIPYATGADTGSELDLATTVGNPGSDTTLVSEQGIREAIAAFSTTLAGLTDTTITGPADLDLLQYDNNSSKWVDRTFAEAGVAAATFTAINALIGAANAAVDLNDQALTSVGAIGCDTITVVANNDVLLSGTGHVTSGSEGFIVGTLTITDGSIDDTDGSIAFGATNFTGVGAIGCGAITTTGHIYLNNEAGIRWKVQAGTSRELISLDTGDDFYVGSSYADSLYLRAGVGYTIYFQDGTTTNVTIDGSGSLDVIQHNAATVGLKLGGTLVEVSAAELNLLDTSVAGTIVNSKGVIYGSSGEVNATTLEIAGNLLNITTDGTDTTIAGVLNITGAGYASDHGAAATDMLVNVCYGTGAPPAANTVTEGAIYIKYVA